MCVPRKNIDDRPAHAELAPALHLGLARVAGVEQLAEDGLAVKVRVFHQWNPTLLQQFGLGQRLLQRALGGEDDARETGAEPGQRGQPLRGGFRVGQRLGHRRVDLREEKKRRAPGLEIVRHFLLRLHARRHGEVHFFRVHAREGREHEGLGRRRQAGELERSRLVRKRAQIGRSDPARERLFETRAHEKGAVYQSARAAGRSKSGLLRIVARATKGGCRGRGASSGSSGFS